MPANNSRADGCCVPHAAEGPAWRRRVVKIVASATLTRDPSKIERLALHCPRYIAVSAEDHR